MSPYGAELLVVANTHEQSCTQSYLLNSCVDGKPQLQNPAAAIQVSNWQFVSLLNQPYDASCDSYVKYSLYYSITTGLTRKINVKQIRQPVCKVKCLKVHSLMGPLHLPHHNLPSPTNIFLSMVPKKNRQATSVSSSSYHVILSFLWFHLCHPRGLVPVFAHTNMFNWHIGVACTEFKIHQT